MDAKNKRIVKKKNRVCLMKFMTNCEGKDAAMQVMAGEKETTRRDKSYTVGEIVEICQQKIHNTELFTGFMVEWDPIGKAKVISCIHEDAWKRMMTSYQPFRIERYGLIDISNEHYSLDDIHSYASEAKKEGYAETKQGWINLFKDLRKCYKPLPPLWRIGLEPLE